MEFKSHGLELWLTPIAQPENHGFWRVDVEAHAPGFTGRVKSWIELNDLMRFEADLERMDSNLTPGDTATLAPVEGDFLLQLEMGSGGHISGTYRIQGELYDGVRPATLSGSFTMDQSYLPALRREVASALAASDSGGSL